MDKRAEDRWLREQVVDAADAMTLLVIREYALNSVGGMVSVQQLIRGAGGSGMMAGLELGLRIACADITEGRRWIEAIRRHKAVTATDTDQDERQAVEYAGEWLKAVKS